jgi:hypothetical protein
MKILSIKIQKRLAVFDGSGFHLGFANIRPVIKQTARP